MRPGFSSVFGALILVFLCTGAALGEQSADNLPDKPAALPDRQVAVSVVHAGEDSLGSQLAFALKDALNSASLFKLTEGDEPKLRILLRTIPEFPTRPAVGSAYSLVWVFSRNPDSLEHFLTHETGVLSRDDIPGLVAQILERTDGLAVKYGYLFK